MIFFRKFRHKPRQFIVKDYLHRTSEISNIVIHLTGANKMQRKAGFSRLSVVQESENTKNQPRAKLQNKKTVSAPLLKFQNLVSTITMTRALLNRSQLRKQNTSGDSGEFHMSHATSPDDDDRRPDTTLTNPSMIRSDVLSRLNMSDHFRFSTRPNRKFQVRYHSRTQSPSYARSTERDEGQIHIKLASDWLRRRLLF